MKTIINKKVLLIIAGIMITLSGFAQTYTTQKAGNWNNVSTWEGGQVPSRNISSGMVVNIMHDVTFNVNGDLTISGVLNITSDTLRFNSSYDDKVKINSSGLLIVRNGGFLQHLPSMKIEMEMNGGRLVVENAEFNVSKTFKSSAGSRKFISNSTVTIGDKYEMIGSGGSKSVDTIRNSTILVKMNDYLVNNHSIVRLSNATLKVLDGSLKVEPLADLLVLPGAVNNLGIDVMEIKKDLENKGDWNARIDAFCIDGDIKGSKMADIDFIRPEDCSLIPADEPAPELTFQNPVLVSGQPNKPGAVYKFSNIYPGIDAWVKIVRFSRSDIVMKNFDKADMGWGKALQPEFGLPGLVKPNQHWYVDFEINFYVSGTSTKTKVRKVDVTALDVDGDNNSIAEYAIFQNPHNVIYSTVSYLNSEVSITEGAQLTCPIDGLLSPLISCLACGGDGKSGYWNWNDCTVCDATGHLFGLCNHPLEGTNGESLIGPVDNFMNIDTAATQVMATYQYFAVDKIKFRYGAKSGSKSSNGSGIRLNSLWFRQFSLAPVRTLPVKLTSFTATYDRKNVLLNWTGVEENFSHYVVQRSIDGKDFKDIATVFATGNNNAATDYSFKDLNVASATGMVFYRLLLVDRVEEMAEVSEVKAIRLHRNQDALKLATYPNPVQDQLRLTLPSSWQGKPVVIEIFTMNGIRVQAMQIGYASQTEIMNLGMQSRGSYLVKVSCNNEVIQERIIKN